LFAVGQDESVLDSLNSEETASLEITLVLTQPNPLDNVYFADKTGETGIGFTRATSGITDAVIADLNGADASQGYPNPTVDQSTWDAVLALFP